MYLKKVLNRTEKTRHITLVNEKLRVIPIHRFIAQFYS